MKILQSINQFRRITMQRITKTIGNKDKVEYKNINIEEIKRVLICRPNHRLGNILLVTPLVQEVSNIFPNCKIDLFVKGNAASIVFINYPIVENIISLPKKHFNHFFNYLSTWLQIRKKKYDITINVYTNSSSGRLSVKYSNSKYKFFGELEESTKLRYTDNMHIAKYPVYNFRNSLQNLGLKINDNNIPSLDLKLSKKEISDGKIILDNLVSNKKKTICLYTYATGDKCLSKNWWKAFYKEINDKLFNYNIIEILPIENSSQIEFIAPVFYSKNIREIGSLIANTELFIGTDSGMMHLASATQIKTIGLFSITDLNRYQPYNNGSFGINTNNLDLNEFVKIVENVLINN